MNGYFCVLTIIDFFILCFMCILTYLSESLSRKQKRGFLLAFVLIAGISILEVITLVVDGLPPAATGAETAINTTGLPLVECCIQLYGVWSVSGCVHLSCVCTGQENSLSS